MMESKIDTFLHIEVIQQSVAHTQPFSHVLLLSMRLVNKGTYIKNKNKKEMPNLFARYIGGYIIIFYLYYMIYSIYLESLFSELKYYKNTTYGICNNV